MTPQATARLLRWLVGPPGPQRLRASQSLLATGAYLGTAAVHVAEVPMGIIAARDAALLIAAICIVGLGFFLVVRFGWNQGFADPSLTVPQMSAGIVIAAWAYAVTGPARAGAMATLLMCFVYALFALDARRARRLALGSFTLFGAVAVWRAHTDPGRYPPGIEAVHLAYVAILLYALVRLASRMHRLRERMKAQKTALARALETNQLLATRDELTGLPNRRHLIVLMVAERNRQQRTGLPLSVALVDLDRFKQINDTLGHSAGDIVLQRFAEVAQQSLRAGDALGRWGGEEFLLVLPDATPEQARLCLERLRTLLAATRFEDVAPGLRITFSAGVCAATPDDLMERVLERADEALYEAKAHGRDRTVLARALHTAAPNPAPGAVHATRSD
jgi:diguanylate cyclase (GGDEF)-like protein